jgi:succinylglutamate desuccinylase
MNKKDVLIVVCQHGNEPFGLEVKKRLEEEFDFIIGNPEAVKQNQRFIETDLNRSFPGNSKGSLEEKRAAEIKKIAKKYKLVIDLHSTTSIMELFAITTKVTDEIIELVQDMKLTKLVHLPESFGKNTLLIDNVPLGISLDVGPQEDTEKIREITTAIRNLVLKRTPEEKNKERKLYLAKPVEIFEVFDVIKGAGIPSSKNFKKVLKGEKISSRACAPFEFYPILAGEDSYEGIIALAARKRFN